MNRTFRVLQLDQTLSSGRLYTSEGVAKAIMEVRKDLHARRVMGEMGIVRDAKIHLDRVSHLVTDLRIEDSTLVADVELLDSPSGKVLKEHLENNGKVTAYPRWIGDGYTNTIDEVTFITVDINPELDF